MEIQIYTMQSVEETLAVIARGVDSYTNRAIVVAVADAAASVALSVESNLDAIVSMSQAGRPAILHLCGLGIFSRI